MASLFLVIACGAVVLIASARRGALWSAPEPASPTSSAAQVAPAVSAAPTSSAATSPAPAGSAEASCDIPDRGSGVWPSDFTKLPLGRMLVPSPVPLDHYDVLLHLHGGEPARKVVAPLRRPDLVMVAIDAGVGSQVYAEALAGGDALTTVLSAVNDALKPAQLRHLIVSSWSAGYGGVRELLTQHPTSIDALVLLDSVHASYEPDGETLVSVGLEPFEAYAKRAIAEQATMVLTHSEIRPPGYASTSEVAAWLLKQVGGRREYAGLVNSHGVSFKTHYDAGRLSLRGYSGKGKPAHCAQLMLLADILSEDVFPKL